MHDAALTDEEIWQNWYRGSGFKQQMEGFPPDKQSQADHITESTRKMIIENDRPTADAQLRKALWWASEWMWKTHDDLTLDCNCGGWLSDRLDELAKAAGIEPWPEEGTQHA